MQQFSKILRRARFLGGFTLLELCATLGLVALLAAATWTAYGASVRSRNIHQAKLQCAALTAALESYQLENGRYPAGLSQLINPKGRAYLDPEAVGLDARTFEDPWGHTWGYILGQNAYAEGYHLASAGPDGRVGVDSVDDITAVP